MLNKIIQKEVEKIRKEKWYWLDKLSPFEIEYRCDEDCSSKGCPHHKIRFGLHSVSDQIEIWFYEDSNESVLLDMNKVNALLKGIKKYNKNFDYNKPL